MKSLKCGKEFDESWVEYKRRTRRSQREAILLERCSERICVVCGSLKLGSRAWIVVKVNDTQRSENEINNSKSAIKVRKILESLLESLPSKMIITRQQIQCALKVGVLCRGCYIKFKNQI